MPSSYSTNPGCSGLSLSKRLLWILCGEQLTPGSKSKPCNEKNLPQIPQMETAEFYISWVNLNVIEAYDHSLISIVLKTHSLAWSPEKIPWISKNSLLAKTPGDSGYCQESLCYFLPITYQDSGFCKCFVCTWHML